MKKRRRGRPRIHISVGNFEFFQVYIPQFSSNHLKLPPEFVKHFGGCTPKRIPLKNLKGQKWDSDINIKKDGLYMETGWPDFVKENSISEGEFLIFRYNGDTGLTVRVFGSDGCKKQEHVMIEPKIEPEIEPEIAHKKDTSEKIKKKRKERSTSFGERSTKSMKRKSSSSSEFQSHRDEEEENLEEVNMLESSSKYPSFKIVITPPLMGRGYPDIPVSFLNKYIKKDTRVMNLQISDTTWEVKLSKMRRSRICSGWKEFKYQNFLCEGDVCVFQLIDHQNLLFKVTIFKSPEEEEEEEEEVNMLESDLKYPSFKVVITPNLMGRGYPDVPMSFLNKYIKQDMRVMNLQISDTTWEVKRSKSRQNRLYAGWKEFRNQNFLCEGDVCVFQLIGRQNLLFKVTIYKPTQHVMIEPKIESENEPEMAVNRNTSEKLKKKRKERSASYGKRSTRSMRTKSSSSSEFQSSGEEQKEEEDLEEVNMLESNSKYPSFKVVITPTLMGRGYPSIPPSFRKKYVTKDADVMNLQVSDTTWEVKPCKGTQCRLCAGWYEFRNQNFICKGDVCFFQLIDRQNLLFKVTICKPTH